MSRYTCNLRGNCEEDPFGGYQSFEDCRGNCQSLDALERENIYLSLSYDPEQALGLSPTDRVEYIKREYGLATIPDDSSDLLISLASDNYLDLYRRGLKDYLQQELGIDDLGLVILEIYSLTPEISLYYWWVRYSIFTIIYGMGNEIAPSKLSQMLVISRYSPVRNLSRDEITNIIERNWDAVIPHILDTNRGYVLDRYSCNLSGQCEENFSGKYSLQECQDRCQAFVGDRDEYLLSLPLTDILELAPNDIERYITLRYGVEEFPYGEPIGVIIAILGKDYLALRDKYPQIAEEILDDFDYLLMKIPNKFLRYGNWDLIRLTYHRYLLRASRTDPNFMYNIQRHLNIYSDPASLIPIDYDDVELLKERYG